MNVNVPTRLTLFGGAVVVAARSIPDLSRLGTQITDLPAWSTQVGIDGVATELTVAALGIVAAWLAVGVLLTLGAELPGLAGRLAAAVARRVVPSLFLRLLAGAAGVGVLIGPVYADARAPANPTPSTSSVVGAARDAPPTPSWPTNEAPHPRLSVTWPLSTPARAATDGTSPVNSPEPTARASVTVRPGDSLWVIAARRLSPDSTRGAIATVWPRWYAANRNTVGADPDLIRPGQILHAPRSSP